MLILLIGQPLAGFSNAQDPSVEEKQKEIERKLADLLKKLPGDEGLAPGEASKSASDYDSSKNADKSADTTNATTDLIDELNSRIAELSNRKRNREEGQQLNQLKRELKIAKSIAGQFSRAPLVRERKSQAPKEPTNSFVVAKIFVPAESTVADVTFESIAGEQENVKSIFEFLKTTPPGSYRDYRIVSRHGNAIDAEKALTATRQEYDAQKERERQILAYISERNRQMARVKRSRRC